ncbi:probable methyltransferase PMT9 [Olea europaea subsp. europaea]|uniref:Methyltransferase n=1 Tax=Olea europaea subsp. europaea TaxID=158383 RepID=A0A8S0SAT5_OLEEU|nr:probable methyltransferase PMT9 [Olea europaea subsp. europaea]
MYDLLRRMCWRVVVRRDQTLIWAKPLSNSCYLKRNPGTNPPMCSSNDDLDATWNVLMKMIWHYQVVEYWKQMKLVVQRNSVGNVMDMNSHLGGFAVALRKKDVWVMNVAPVNASNKLKIIYDRGFIGTVHDWCESFSTYPRTYDLLRARSKLRQLVVAQRIC